MTTATTTMGRSAAIGLDDQLRRFLLGMAALVAVAVIVGGGTRLTESGLSITEWNVVSGILPPLDVTVWLDEFEKYRRTVQYRDLNQGMTLDDFKIIYLWEWSHRLIGRVIGTVYLAGFVWFWWCGAYDRRQPLFRQLLGVGLLIALQGAIGWWMVHSGLFDRVNVAPYRLAIHLTLACIIFACLIWLAQSRRAPAHRSPLSARQTLGPLLIVAVIFLQIFLGALVAGNRAGYVFQTWPTMDGALIPATLFEIVPWWRNIFENAGLVQFLHRLTAYALLALALANAAIWQRGNSGAPGGAIVVLILVCGQAGLGIATLLSGMNLLVALGHQAGLLVVLIAALRHAHDRSRPQAFAATASA